MGDRARLLQELPVGWGPEGPVAPKLGGLAGLATPLIVAAVVSFGALALLHDPVTAETGSDGVVHFRSVTVLYDAVRWTPVVASLAVWIALITMLRIDGNLDAIGPRKGVTAALLTLVALPLAVAVPIVRQAEMRWIEHGAIPPVSPPGHGGTPPVSPPGHGPIAVGPRQYALLELSQRAALLCPPPRRGLLGRVYEVIAQAPLDEKDYPRVAWPTHRGVEVQRAADGERLVGLDDGSCVFVFDPSSGALRQALDLDFSDIPVFILVGKDDPLDPASTSWLEEALRDWSAEKRARLARRLETDRGHPSPLVRALVADLLKRLQG